MVRTEPDWGPTRDDSYFTLRLVAEVSCRRAVYMSEHAKTRVPTGAIATTTRRYEKEKCADITNPE